ncbi:MAG: nucleotide exchange factor GrpE [Acidiferrobacteraceae bacterium]|nr:nucleotide exchange factor GrpE [Acidiferrobacteraceae bacterium]
MALTGPITSVYPSINCELINDCHMSQNTVDTANDATSPVPLADSKPEDAPAEFADEVTEDAGLEAPADGDTVCEPAKELPDSATALAEAITLAAELTGEVESLKDEALRARAEVDNIRKRSQAEVASIRRYAVEGFARELLGVRDSLDLARGVDLSTADGDVAEKVVEGLDITLKQLDSLMEKFSIQAVEPEVGEKLDPELHQAVSTVESDELEPNCIHQCIQKGYRLHDRLLRPAMVIVAKPPTAA